MARENLWDSADSGAYDEQIAAGSLYQDGSESLSQAGMQVYVTSNHDVANFFMTYRAQKRYSIVEDMAVEHLFKVNCFGTGTSDYETHVGMRSEDARDGSNEEIGAFVVEKTRDDDDGDGIIGAEWLRGLRWRRWQSGAHRRLGGILGMERAEVGCNDSIGDDRDHEGIKRGAENRVLLARMADTDDMIHIAEGKLEELVG